MLNKCSSIIYLIAEDDLSLYGLYIGSTYIQYSELLRMVCLACFLNLVCTLYNNLYKNLSSSWICITFRVLQAILDLKGGLDQVAKQVLK